LVFHENVCHKTPPEAGLLQKEPEISAEFNLIADFDTFRRPLSPYKASLQRRGARISDEGKKER
jgi:hypothetical protein